MVMGPTVWPGRAQVYTYPSWHAVTKQSSLKTSSVSRSWASFLQTSGSRTGHSSNRGHQAVPISLIGSSMMELLDFLLLLAMVVALLTDKLLVLLPFELAVTPVLAPVLALSLLVILCTAVLFDSALPRIVKLKLRLWLSALFRSPPNPKPTSLWVIELTVETAAVVAVVPLSWLTQFSFATLLFVLLCFATWFAVPLPLAANEPDELKAAEARCFAHTGCLRTSSVMSQRQSWVSCETLPSR